MDGSASVSANVTVGLNPCLCLYMIVMRDVYALVLCLQCDFGLGDQALCRHCNFVWR